jgi:kinesin family protein 3/17
MRVNLFKLTISLGSRICIEIDKKVNQVIIKKNAGEEKAFSYDAVYDWNSTQRSVYDESAFPLVESVLEGYNGTIFAYG